MIRPQFQRSHHLTKVFSRH